MMRRVLLAALVGSVTLLSCTDDPTATGLAQGGIAFEIHTVGIMPRSSAAGVGEPAAVGAPSMVGPARTHGASIDSARVILTSPALSAARIVPATPGNSVTVSSLPVGTYAAELQGWHEDELVYQGSVSGIQVRSDEESAVAQVLFAPTRLDFESIGETVQLTSPTGTVWSSNQPGIVEVSTTGLLTALTNGSASISGTLAGSTAGVQASVAQRVVTVEIDPPSASIAAGATQQFTAKGFDALGAEVSGANALWVSSNHLVAMISPTGLATGTGGGTADISASVRGEPGSANLTVTGEAPAVRLRFVTLPPATAEDGSFSVSVQVESAVGTRVASSSGAVTLAIGTNPAGGTLSGVKTVNAVNGLATFDGLKIDEVGTGYTLTASSGSLTGATSAPFDVVSNAPVRLAFLVIPTAVVSGLQTFSVAVQVLNAAGSVALGAANPVTLAIGTNPSGGTLTGLATVHAVNGTANFNPLSIDGVGSGYTLTATSGSLTGATSEPFDVVSSAPTQLLFSTSSLTLLPDQQTAFSVTVRNAAGTIVTGSSDTITVALGTNPSGGTLSGVTKVTAVNGQALFSGISIDEEGVGYTLTATSGSLSATPLPVTVVSPAATQLGFSSAPSPLLPDSTFSITVFVRNAAGSIVTTATNPVTLAIGTNPSGGTLSGIKTVNAVGGVASFSGLSINNPGAGYTLTATSGSLTAATTSGFSVASPPTQIAFRIQPGATYATRSFPSTVQVELRDALGTRVQAGNYTVSLSIGTNPGAGTLSGTTATTSFSGVASFFNLSINNKGVGYTLTASVTGLPNVDSAPFDVQGVTTLFTNTTYVNYVPGDLGAEASNLEASLNAVGVPLNTTTDISDAGVAAVLATSDVYVIPEQETGDLTAALAAGARAAIVAWVNAGGTLVVHYSGTRHLTLMNTLFGLAVTSGSGTSPFTLAPAAAGTPFAAGPASVPSLSATLPVEDTSLPGGSQVIYRSPSTSDAAVAVIPRTSGRIVYIGWDWYDAPPVGFSSGNPAGGLDWLEVLRRATDY